MGHWLWFGTAKQRNVPIRALLRFGNVKLKNVKVASVVVGAVLGRALLVGVALFFVTEKLECPPPTPARMGMVLCCLLVYSGGHERCRLVGLGIRALPVGVAGTPGALAVRRSFIRQYTSEWTCPSGLARLYG